MRETMKESMPRTKNSRSSNDSEKAFICGDCGRSYKVRSSLFNHRKWECGKEPRFKCPYCTYKAKQKVHMIRHLRKTHNVEDFADINSLIINNVDEVKKEKVVLPKDSKTTDG
ncbi:unnamed protein product [Phaedon cochleariae]|uniref:C2H2-type domain-containing protein n=1 Tax=Phaedon cochleariae TaxID=80249 RepID=A0A9N9SGB4_PHACE|nr:unnamed protein product [Phaedon cochleariae]